MAAAPIGDVVNAVTRRSERTERIRCVIFYAKSLSHWRRVLADTLVGALRLRPENVPSRWHRYRHVRFLFEEEFRVASYVVDWQDAFAEAPSLEAELCNVNNLLEYRAGLRKLRDYPLSIVLHSVAWDEMALLRRAAGYFQDRRGKLMVFFGNEYNCMPEKIGFAREARADYIASQLPASAAAWLYADCCHSKIVQAPQALNPKIYQPRAGPRPVDIGFRGDLYSFGDMERTEILRYFADRAEAWGLVQDVQFVRLPREEWSRFLAGCKGTVGAESGTYYLERDDHTEEAVKRYLRRHPGAGFSEVYDLFFRHYPNPVSGKAISSRHFEPIGTKTCQMLLEGHYNGILKPDEHYISIKKNFANIDDAVRRFKDEEYRRAMVERAYEYVMESHTYRHRVEGLLKTVVDDGLPSQ